MAIRPGTAHAPGELARATQVFLTAHAEALAADDFARAHAATQSLLEGLCEALPRAVQDARQALGDGIASRDVPRVEDSGFPDLLAALARQDPAARETAAYGVLRKRLAEAEGALLHLQLTLRTRPQERPLPATHAARLARQVETARLTLRALAASLSAWSEAAATLVGATAETAARVSPRETLRAARAALLAGAPVATAQLARRALAAGLVEPVLREAPPEATLEDAFALWEAAGGALPAARATVAAVEAALAAPRDDPVQAWVLLDAVERLVAAAGMTPLPAREAAATRWHATRMRDEA